MSTIVVENQVEEQVVEEKQPTQEIQEEKVVEQQVQPKHKSLEEEFKETQDRQFLIKQLVETSNGLKEAHKKIEELSKSFEDYKKNKEEDITKTGAIPVSYSMEQKTPVANVFQSGAEAFRNLINNNKKN